MAAVAKVIRPRTFIWKNDSGARELEGLPSYVEVAAALTEKVGPGSLIYIPRGNYHSTFNTGWEPMRVLAVFSPPGPVQALRAVGDSGGVGTAEMRIVPAGVTPTRK